MRTSKVSRDFDLSDAKAVGPVVAAAHAEAIVLDQVEHRGRAFMVAVGKSARNRLLVELHFRQPVAVGLGLVVHVAPSRPRRSATDRAWAVRPSASPSVTAAGPSVASDRASHLRIEVRLTKS